MTALEYRATLSRLGLTQTGAARLLGVTGRTSRRWAAGETIPQSVVLHLRLIETARHWAAGETIPQSLVLHLRLIEREMTRIRNQKETRP